MTIGMIFDIREFTVHDGSGIRTSVFMSGQQLQLNALNAATLLDAQAHPESHKNLIVRVWGWSGYFCELAPEYQNHIIARTLFQTVSS